MELEVSKHAISQGIRRLKEFKNISLTKRKMRKKIHNICKYGAELPAKGLGVSRYQCKETGLICVVIRNFKVVTCVVDNIEDIMEETNCS